MIKSSIYRRYEPAVISEGRTGQTGTSFWFAFGRAGLLVANSGDSVSIPRSSSLSALGIDPVRKQYLGTLDGIPCWSAELPQGIQAPDAMSYCDLRSLYGRLDEDLYLLAGRALQIVNWDQTHQFCGRCGARTEDLDGERAKKCPSCGFASYPRLSPATITAVLKGDKILLAHYATFRGNMHTVIAGFVEPGETLEECVAREVLEEVGLRVKNVRYFGSQPWPFPNSLMIGFTAEWESGEIKVDGKEISHADWYDAGSLPEIPPKMAIAREIIDWFAERK